MESVDVVVVGAGFGGLYAVHQLSKLGLSVRGIERNEGIGGTWFMNRYPGARCDVDSLDYSYSFSPEIEQEWQWSERFSTQSEILAYLNFVADRLDLRRHFALATTVQSARFDEGSDCWVVGTDRGQITAQFCIFATGCLSTPQLPNYAGIETFAGQVLHTQAWPAQSPDLARASVGVMGTGSSGIQLIPRLASQVKHLTVFQRTPSYTVPAQNAPLTPDFQAKVKAGYRQRREAARSTPTGSLHYESGKRALEFSEDERADMYEAAWTKGGGGMLSLFSDLLLDAKANETAASFVRNKIASLVEDPAIASVLTPKDYHIGAKRLCVDTDYYKTFNLPNVTLVDLRAEPIQEFTADGPLTSCKQYTLDTMVFATGFDAMTGSLMNIDIRGVNSISLGEKWSDGPKTYLGLAIGSFPNMFIVAGPGSPSVLSNMVMSIEMHVDWIAECIRTVRAMGATRIEAEDEAEERWTQRLAKLAEMTLLGNAASWYTGANIPGKPRVFSAYLGGAHRYRGECAKVASEGYRGFRVTAVSA